MFDDTKIQALADDLRQIVCEQNADIADELLNGIISRLLVEMLEDRNRCLALLETLMKEFDSAVDV